MDFFANQDEARKKTSQLIIYFGLAVIFIIVAIYLAIVCFFVYRETGQGQISPDRFWDLELFATVSLVTLLVVLSGSLYKVSMLRSGGAVVAEMLGGKLIPASTADFLEKRFLNIVGEMAIASGVPVPPVYLMEREQGINAFAAGFSPDDAVIGITRGALETLNREELQGVVAHEFSHILNGDMRLDLKLVGVLHGILLIALIGRSILHGSSRSRSNKNSGGAVLFGLVLLILGYVGVIFGKLIKSAVSRQREYLADASAVQFTRDTQGLAGALKKIGGLAAGSLVNHNKAEEISHMFFSNGLKGAWSVAFSTHPPLVERIRRLEPSFDGVYPEVEQNQAQYQRADITEKARGSLHERKKGAVPMSTLVVSDADMHNLTRDMGAPVKEHMEYARRLLEGLPPVVREATDNPFGARAVIYGLLLDREETIRSRQLEILRYGADRPVFEATAKILPFMQSLDEEVRLPLMDLAMVSLRSMSLEQFRRFEKNINELIRADQRISLFEFTLQYVVLKRLERNFIKPLSSVKEIRAIEEVAAETSAVLSLLANLGHGNGEARKAFSRAAESFGRQAAEIRYLSREECRNLKLGDILDRLANLTPRVKKGLVDACFQCLVHDNRITMKEAEFFRLLAYGLDCPLPPWIRI